MQLTLRESSKYIFKSILAYKIQIYIIKIICNSSQIPGGAPFNTLPRSPFGPLEKH